LDAWIALSTRLESVEAARQWLLRQLEGHAVAPDALLRMELVLEELLMNALTHGRPGERDAATGREFMLRLGATIQPEQLLLCLEDDGVPFDPATAKLPAAATSLAEARVGGLGLVLVRKSSRSLRHVREDGVNRLWVELPLTSLRGS
jgi:anti-sigma regulatory factor (Ser/Thr protein kinase)